MTEAVTGRGHEGETGRAGSLEVAVDSETEARLEMRGAEVRPTVESMSPT